MKKVDFVILASPRSGSSVFRNYLNGIREVGIPPESPFPLRTSAELRHNLPNWTDKSAVSDHLASVVAQDNKLVLWNVPSEKMVEMLMFRRPSTWSEVVVSIYEAYFDMFPRRPNLYGDKNNSYMSYLEGLSEAFPKPKLIHLVRNPGDVVGSQLNFTTTRKSNLAPQFRDDPPALLEHWAQSNINVVQFAANQGLDIHLVRYEELVQSAQKVTKAVAAFLGIDLPHNYRPKNAWRRYPESENFLDWKSKSRKPLKNLTTQYSETVISDFASNRVQSVAESFGYGP